MSTPPEPLPANPPAPASPPAAQAPFRWYHKLFAVLVAACCLEAGCFLLVFPWTSHARDFAAFWPEWGAYRDNMYVRGAISGLGLVNLYISVIEIHRLRRFARR